MKPLSVISRHSRPGVHVVFGEQLGHVLGQLAVHEIARRDVHRHLQRQALAQPFAALAHRLAQHPARQ